MLYNRSIPARAGETWGVTARVIMAQVYPRTGGGNKKRAGELAPFNGLSPHGRGKREFCLDGDAAGRSIPARAGETRWFVDYSYLSEVYPRTGGGNGKESYRDGIYQGLSPHGRGKPPPNS